MLTWCMEWMRRRATDAVIDDLIARNGAKAITDMALVDHQKLERAGERVWQETLRAQRRRTQPENVVRFGRR
jgi:hypothetical protein